MEFDGIICVMHLLQMVFIYVEVGNRQIIVKVCSTYKNTL